MKRKELQAQPLSRPAPVVEKTTDTEKIDVEQKRQLLGAWGRLDPERRAELLRLALAFLRQQVSTQAASKKQPTHQAHRGFRLDGESGDDAEVVAWQKTWLNEAADKIEKGDLPTEDWGRAWLARAARGAADRIHAPAKSKKAGNPHFVAKVPSDDTLPLLVWTRIVYHGQTLPEAIATVADAWGVDESTVRKTFLYFKRRLGAIPSE